MCALARTTPTTFVLLGADACHFAGSLRPSPFIPLPEMLTEDAGLDKWFASPCPCEIFGECHPGKDGEKDWRVSSYYEASRAFGSAYVDPHVADRSVNSLKMFDADPNIMICLAHDPGLFEVLPLFNTSSNNDINDWKEKQDKEKTRWRFLNELPRNGKPGREPIVFGYWRDGKQVSVEEAMTRSDDDVRVFGAR